MRLAFLLQTLVRGETPNASYCYMHKPRLIFSTISSCIM